MLYLYLFLFNLCILSYTSYEFLKLINNLNIKNNNLNNISSDLNIINNSILNNFIILIKKFKLINTNIWINNIFINTDYTIIKIGYEKTHFFINLITNENKLIINLKEFIINNNDITNIILNDNIEHYINKTNFNNKDMNEYIKIIKLINYIKSFNLLNNDIIINLNLTLTNDIINSEINNYIATNNIIINNINKFLIISKIFKIPLNTLIKFNSTYFGLKIMNNYKVLNIGFNNIYLSIDLNNKPIFYILINDRICIYLSIFDILAIINNEYNFNKIQDLSFEEKEHINNLLFMLKKELNWINTKSILYLIHNIESIEDVNNHVNDLLLNKPYNYNIELIIFEKLLKEELHKFKYLNNYKIVKKCFKNKIRNSININVIKEIIKQLFLIKKN